MELQALACFVHGALSSLHVLGVLYNVRRRNWWDVAIHSTVAVYDFRAAIHHGRQAINESSSLRNLHPQGVGHGDGSWADPDRLWSACSPDVFH